MLTQNGERRRGSNSSFEDRGAHALSLSYHMTDMQAIRTCRSRSVVRTSRRTGENPGAAVCAVSPDTLRNHAATAKREERERGERRRRDKRREKERRRDDILRLPLLSIPPRPSIRLPPSLPPSPARARLPRPPALLDSALLVSRVRPSAAARSVSSHISGSVSVVNVTMNADGETFALAFQQF